MEQGEGQGSLSAFDRLLLVHYNYKSFLVLHCTRGNAPKYQNSWRSERMSHCGRVAFRVGRAREL